MGGGVPLGYRVEDRALHVVEEEAEFVRALFSRYLEVGSVVRLKTVLDAENVRSPLLPIEHFAAFAASLERRGGAAIRLQSMCEHVYLGEGGGKPITVSDGYCKFFVKDQKISSIVCGMKVDETGRRTVAVIGFEARGARR